MIHVAMALVLLISLAGATDAVVHDAWLAGVWLTVVFFAGLVVWRRSWP